MSQDDSNSGRGRRKYTVVVDENKKLKEELEKFKKLLKDSQTMPPPSQPDIDENNVDMSASQ